MHRLFTWLGALVKHFTMPSGLAEKTLHAMTTQSTPQDLANAHGIDDLYTLALVDGLSTMQAGKELKYQTVRLRETNVADERAAVRMAERVVVVGGAPKLLVSEADFRFAMTMRHCERFVCGDQALVQGLIDLDTFSKLSNHDLQLIEERVVLITLAAQVRYGLITHQEFESFLSGKQASNVAPQPVGQAADVGGSPSVDQSGPEMLSDFTGAGAQGSAGGVA